MSFILDALKNAGAMLGTMVTPAVSPVPIEEYDDDDPEGAVQPSELEQEFVQAHSKYLRHELGSDAVLRVSDLLHQTILINILQDDRRTILRFRWISR
jgi:hypothetical protein